MNKWFTRLGQRRPTKVWRVFDKRRFLKASMEELAGNAHISFEGDLSAIGISNLHGASGEPTPILKRNTIWPKQDFVIVPLETDLVKEIISAIGGTVPRSIIHIQIEKAGCLELSVCDNFDPRSMYFGTSLSPDFFVRLEAEGIIRQWTNS